MNDDFHPTHFATHESVEHAFYEALERADVEAMMNCWADEDDVVCIHPGGRKLTGHRAIRQGWTEIFANGPVHARAVSVHVQQSMMMAIHSVVEQVQVMGDRGRTVVNVFATNVYGKTPNGWRMVLHHASLVPDHALTESRSQDADQGSTLH
ncbi:MAG TPA: nuclear transport factor 2 family protein [Burkholderiaceae bacterium]|nr:nuclear transport factor 2 family protein [Burkholderiaceae bacterium]